MPRIPPRLRRAARLVADLFPFTPLGLLVLAGAAPALFHFALRRQDLVLLVVGLLGVGLPALTLLVTTGAAVGLWASLRKRPAADAMRMECGFAARTGFSLPTLWYVPFVKLSWSWVEPEAAVKPVKDRGRFHEEITPTRRGLYDVVVRRIEVGDAFGLTRVAFRAKEARAVRFVPSMGQLKQMHVVRSIAGGEDITHPAGPPEGERADLRNYAPGDPIRFVLWKVFARTRQVVVRTPERALSPVKQTVAYLVAGEGDEAAAGAARVAVECGALGSEWVLGADGCEVYAKNGTQALEVLARSARTTAEQAGAGLGTFLRTATPGAVGRAVVFVPPKPGPWLDKVVAAARARAAGNQALSPVEFVVCTDGIDRPPRGNWLTRVALRADRRADGARGPAPALKADVDAVISALAGSRSKVLLVDRVAGRVFTEGHRRALEAA